MNEIRRYDNDEGLMIRDSYGKWVDFTDHERVVADFVKVVDAHRGVISDFIEDIDSLRTALAASRAEVEGLIEVAKVYLHGEYQDPEVEYSSEYRARRYKEGKALAKAIAAAAMEKGND